MKKVLFISILILSVFASHSQTFLTLGANASSINKEDALGGGYFIQVEAYNDSVKSSWVVSFFSHDYSYTATFMQFGIRKYTNNKRYVRPFYDVYLTPASIRGNYEIGIGAKIGIQLGRQKKFSFFTDLGYQVLTNNCSGIMLDFGFKFPFNYRSKIFNL
jgi:hypothetical protein